MPSPLNSGRGTQGANEYCGLPEQVPGITKVKVALKPALLGEENNMKRHLQACTKYAARLIIG